MDFGNLGMKSHCVFKVLDGSLEEKIVQKNAHNSGFVYGVSE